MTTPEATPVPVTAPRLLAALRRHWPRENGWLVFTEVTTGQGERRADAICINVFPSRHGQRVVGVEVKANRGDWFAELARPEKSAGFRDQVQEWWLVAGQDVIRYEEVPDECGLLVLKEDGDLGLVRNAQSYPRVPSPDLAFALLRHAYDASPSVELLQAAVEMGRDQGKAAGIATCVASHARRDRQEIMNAEQRGYNEAMRHARKKARMQA